MSITKEFLLANHGTLLAELSAAAATEAFKKGHAEGVALERKRISEIDVAAVSGHEALTTKAKAEGWSADQYAGAVLRAEKEQRTAKAGDLKKDAPDPVRGADPEQKPAVGASHAAPSGFSVNAERSALHTAALAYQAQHKCDYVTAAKAVGAR